MARREFTAEEEERLQADLAKQLGPEFISQRSGPGGKFTYIEGQAAIQLANELFGFNGWTSELRNFTVDFVDEHDGKVDVGVSAVVRVTLKDGTFHEDVGYGQMENSRSKAAAMEKAKKEAMTDALKRALRMFGNVMGNCIYDKAFTGSIQHMKRPAFPFDPKALYRDKRYQIPSSVNTTSAQQQPTSSSSVSAKPTAAAQSDTTASPVKGAAGSKPSKLLSITSPVTRSVTTRQQLKQEPEQVSTTKTRPSKSEEPVVSTQPPNQPPTPLRSTLTQEDSFSMEGDDEFFALLADHPDDFDKPDMETQPLPDDEPALNFTWSTSGDLKRASHNSKRKSIAEASPTRKLARSVR